MLAPDSQEGLGTIYKRGWFGFRPLSPLTSFFALSFFSPLYFADELSNSLFSFI